ncbi:ferroxidase fet3 [Coemansia sp. RSA 353]|nr:ferroxidase fet3 [Coemansia sp. RSA 788]KAJ2168082.1 ferroxidase fet3 [Coemansia sp. RSA 562]KAJ2176055.1 ferroxidase fet3 [Coemansia sp. RSA 560]KAJ2190697.1 ferroxidase fet3 [Coemansia sp. RSA 532]KAJ2199204.1 ferroxidase fet3 [Coemansia sp. RSA 530]KAJ2200419.1 ferroxidase fet3 [Coemansia sp. RSA 522]KAJ2208417.1 ferroxidase fet3 [Coemansia sp. RSA 521]KAJ2230818.1 ferroxidase fet3 [Coemansia sp. RSA 518]KAJ2256703.1 ferroxidase fet3 [Coemansia sp. RSA 454]KAJ2275775.1 ferroxidase fe
MKWGPRLVIGTALALCVAAKNVVHYWDLTYAQANPDGLFERRVIGVNGVWPPPTIHATLNDTLTIEVRNSLDDAVTIHAHGLLNNNTSYMDGAFMITQCGIPPGANFTYVYELTGCSTQWIHAHKDLMYVDGLRAPLIVHNPNEPHKYDKDVVVTLEDWYHQESPELIDQYFSWKNPGGAEPVPNSAFVRVDGEEGPWKVETNTTYRLRLVNMSALSTFHFAIEGHSLKVIEVDGVDTEAYEVTNVQLSAAQRVSVLVTTLNTTLNNYVYHADMDTDMFDTVPDGLVYNLTGTIEYASGAPVKHMETEWNEFADFNLIPVDKQPALGADVSLSLEIEFGQFTDARNHGSFNNITYEKPSLPSLLTALSADDPFDPLVYGRQTNAWVVPYMKDVEIVISNKDSGHHPIHAHHGQYQLVARGQVPYDPEQKIQLPESPMRRDTFIIPSGEYAVLRFRSSTATLAFLHCHIVTLHEYTGLAMLLVVAPDVMRETTHVPQVVYDQCEQQGIAISGAAREQSGPDLYPTGWTRKAKGALAGCIIAALVGFTAILWYGWKSNYRPVRTSAEL